MFVMKKKICRQRAMLDKNTCSLIEFIYSDHSLQVAGDFFENKAVNLILN